MSTESGGPSRRVTADELSEEDVHAVVAHVEAGFRAAQAELRDQLFLASSVDEGVRLEINGEGLAVRVEIDPELLERGPRAVELGVMQAMNDAAIMLQQHTTIVFQLATAQLLGLPTGDESQDL